MSDREARDMSRREAVHLLGIGAVGVLGGRVDDTWRAQPEPKSAIVRTVSGDVAPSRLTGATLMHEHLSMFADGNHAWAASWTRHWRPRVLIRAA